MSSTHFTPCGDETFLVVVKIFLVKIFTKTLYCAAGALLTCRLIGADVGQHGGSRTRIRPRFDPPVYRRNHEILGR